MLKERWFEPLSGAGTGWRSSTSAWGWRVLRVRSCSRNSVARPAADLSNSGSAAFATVIPWPAEQVGAQAQRIEACAASRSSKLSLIGRCTIIRIATNTTTTRALSVPATHASHRRTSARSPVGSKKTCLPIMGGSSHRGCGRHDPLFTPRREDLRASRQGERPRPRWRCRMGKKTVSGAAQASARSAAATASRIIPNWLNTQ